MVLKGKLPCNFYAFAVSYATFDKAPALLYMTFSYLPLSEPLIKAIVDKGYSTPSPIQEKAIPAIVDGKDVMAAAQTGTGKTAGFTLPLLERLQSVMSARHNRLRALVLTPTRELAAQVNESIVAYGKYTELTSVVVFGGVNINPQMMKLRKGADILVATPGRLLDLYQQNAITFAHLETLVLDEADRMLDMGFIHDIRRIIKLLPAKRQNLLFSATFSTQIRDLAKGIVNNPIEISVAPANSTAKTVKQWIHPVDKKQKPGLLCHLIHTHKWQQVLVFTRTKHGANKLAQQLAKKHITAAAIHGNKSQGARTKALAAFKAGDVRVLVATDIAARGLDINQLPQVVNFDLPNVAEDYVHRTGRTGRAGATGQAVSLVSADEVNALGSIEQLIKQKLTRKIIDDFDPIHQLPETHTAHKHIRPKKPKKPKPQHPRNKNQTKGQDSNNRRETNNKNKHRRPKTKAKR